MGLSILTFLSLMDSKKNMLQAEKFGLIICSFPATYINYKIKAYTSRLGAGFLGSPTSIFSF
jgi:hypothetical protein